jgi:hypothetical protein
MVKELNDKTGERVNDLRIRRLTTAELGQYANCKSTNECTFWKILILPAMPFLTKLFHNHPPNTWYDTDDNVKNYLLIF